MDKAENPFENKMREWAWLPCNVLDIILDKFACVSHYLRFGAVCKPWLSVAIHRLDSSFSKVPLLLVPTKDSSKEWRSLYSATQRKLYDFKLHVPMNKRCCGSSHGWLSFVEKDTSITLFNPFTRGLIHLPPFNDGIFQFIDTDSEDNIKGHPYDVFKLILSADPNLHPDNFSAAIIAQEFQSIAYLRYGDQQWKNIVFERRRTFCMDIIYYKGLFHALNLDYLGNIDDYCTQVVCFDVNGSNDNPAQLKLVWPEHTFYERKNQKYEFQYYLVESSADGNLLIIQRFLEQDKEIEISFVTSKFKVFKLIDDDINQGNFPKAVEVKSLEGNAVFLGDNCSTSVLASDFPGIQPDCIYYTEHYNDISPYCHYGPRDIGVYNAKDGSISSHYVPDVAHKDLPPPIWIHPTCFAFLNFD